MANLTAVRGGWGKRLVMAAGNSADWAVCAGGMAGLALSVAPLAAVALASLPISIPAMLLEGRKKTEGFNWLAALALFGVAPLLALFGFKPLIEWRERRAADRAERVKRLGLPAADRALFKAVEAADAGALARCLSRGANANARDCEGSSPLLIAALNPSSRPAVFEALLAAGADPGARNHQGIAPLLALSFSSCHARARLLIDAGARVEDPSETMSFDAFALKAGGKAWARATRAYEASLKG